MEELNMDGFTDNLSPLQKGRVLKRMQQLMTVYDTTGKIVTIPLHTYIHTVFSGDNLEIKVFNNDSFFVNRFSVGKTAYEYLLFLIDKSGKYKTPTCCVCNQPMRLVGIYKGYNTFVCSSCETTESEKI
jgi:hypothetical protein